MTVPRATVRLQFNRDFTFAHGRALVPYFAALGASHIYASPIFTASAGSTHGYDVVDPTRVNPELGGEEELRALVAVLRRHGMGLIVDIVPNHMGIAGNENAWWLDVLARGPASPYAGFFDIDWQTPEPDLRGKVHLPVLGAPYGECLARGELRLKADEGGSFHVDYYGRRFPIAPETAARIQTLGLSAFSPDSGDGRECLHLLLENQHYRLAWWRTAGEEINWRRFFDINELAGLRVEVPAVFEAVHATLFRLYAEGLVDGVRIDHVDGLADPRGYCRRLRRRLESLAKERPEGPTRPHIVVEKILGVGEELPRHWLTDGTTGYDFMGEVAALLNDPAGEAPLTKLWAEVSGRSAHFADEEEQARREIATLTFAAECEACARALHRVARRHPATRDFTRSAIRRVLLEILAHFPVYRTYAGSSGRGEADCRVMADVIARAVASCRPPDRPVLDAVDRILGGEPPSAVEPAEERERLRAIRRFQQLTAPIAAKAVEDTSFYRYGRLLSLNEVGSDPGRFSLSPAGFHALAARRAETYPAALIATATHDHKRGEDVRARLAVLSEGAAEWVDAVRCWRTLNAPLRQALAGGPAPEGGDEAMLYQMLVGAWPLDLRADDAEGVAAYGERLAGWQRKALREAKLRSSWATPDEAYEEACRVFLFALLDPSRPFLTEAARFVDTIAAAGAVNGLTQTLIRLTSPGVPDLYQGTEFWDFSLVDPDNRRPVDFNARQAALGEGADAEKLLGTWRDGRIKQAVIRRVLAVRAAHPALFAEGRYRPLPVAGSRANHVIASMRGSPRSAAIAVAARLPAGLVRADRPEIAPEQWADTRVVLPEGSAGATLTEVITGRTLAAAAAVSVAELLRPLPVALWLRAD